MQWRGWRQVGQKLGEAAGSMGGGTHQGGRPRQGRSTGDGPGLGLCLWPWVIGLLGGVTIGSFTGCRVGPEGGPLSGDMPVDRGTKG